MHRLFDAFWRAAAYCLHPGVMVLSLLPLVAMGALAALVYAFAWDPLVDLIRAILPAWPLIGSAHVWLEGLGHAGAAALLAPIVVIVLATPIVVVVSLLLVSAFLTPAVVKLLGRGRFATLERRYGGSWWGAAAHALGVTMLALLAFIVTLPLWFVPPLMLFLPPLIWGWLTYRVLSYDVLADHASAEERRELLRRHRRPLFIIGVVSGYLGTAPAFVWAFGALSLLLAPVLVPVAIWLYTLVFAFSSLWFAHYALTELEAMRASPGADLPLGAPSTVSRLPGAQHP